MEEIAKSDRANKVLILLGAAIVLSFVFMCLAAIDGGHWMTCVFAAELALSVLMMCIQRKRMKERNKYEYKHL